MVILQKKLGESYCYVVLMAAVYVIMISYGIHYTFGVFFNSIMTDLGLSKGLTSAIFSVYMIVSGLSAIGAGKLYDSYGPRITLTLGGFLSGLGLLLTSQVRTAWQIFASYGIVVGIGMGIPYSPSIFTVTRWFTKKQDSMLGIAVSGTGLGMLTMPTLAGFLISLYGWRTSYAFFLIMAWSIPFVGLLIKLPEKIEVIPNYKDDMHAQEGKVRKITIRGAISSRQFWTLFLVYFIFLMDLQMLMVHIIPFAEGTGITVVAASSILGVLGVCSVVGRVAIGFLSDKMGTTNSMLFCLIFQASGVLLLMETSDLLTLYIFAVVFGFFYGACAPLFPAAASKIFGQSSIGTIFGILMLGAQIGGATGPYVAGYLFDLTRSYYIAFLLCFASYVIAAGLTKLLTSSKSLSG